MPERVVAFDHRVCIANRVTRQAQRHRRGGQRVAFLPGLTVIVSIITLIHSDNYLEKIATKITLADIAREARVGVATVDRVLNKRAAVKESTALRVLEAARRLGFTLEQPHYRGCRQSAGHDQNGLYPAAGEPLLLPAVGPGAEARGCPMATGGPGAGDTAFCHRCGGSDGSGHSPTQR